MGEAVAIRQSATPRCHATAGDFLPRPAGTLRERGITNMHHWDFISRVPSADKSGGWQFAVEPCFASTDAEDLTARLK